MSYFSLKLFIAIHLSEILSPVLEFVYVKVYVAINIISGEMLWNLYVDSTEYDVNMLIVRRFYCNEYDRQ